MTLQPRAASILGILGILGLCFSLLACNPSMTSADGGGPLPADIGMAAELSPRCASSSQCTGDEGAPICAAQRCVPCTSHTDSECAVHRAGTPRCDVTSGHCVACLPDTQAADCGKAVPVCDHNACRACRSHYECSALVCNSDGSCAAPSDVVYVDAGNCSGMTPDGSSTKPFCQITDALLATNAFGPLAGKSIIRVAGSATGYGGITIDRSLTLVGPGRNVAPTAAIHGTFKSAAISVSGAGISVSLDGFDIGAAQDGISCTSGSNVTVLRSYIHGLAGAGVTATGCTFTLDGSTVTNNGGGGVIMINTSYRIVNNFITQNGPVGRGVSLNDASDGVFAFNTVANNQFASPSAGGLSCGSKMMKSIYASIFWNNSFGTNGGLTQIAGMCSLKSVVTSSDSFLGATVLEPQFQNPTKLDYHLMQPSLANDKCCVDKVNGMAGTLPAHDVDWMPRPVGAGWDIGAHEVQ